MPNYHVIKNKKTKKWYVKRENAKRMSAKSDTQLEAEKIAKKICRKAGGGEVRIHSVNGEIRDSDTVAPGNDPNPPLDRKH